LDPAPNPPMTAAALVGKNPKAIYPKATRPKSYSTGNPNPQA
jgi:hypothetical protein